MQRILLLSRHPEFAAMVAYGIRKLDKVIEIIYMAVHVEFPAARYSSDIDKFIYCSKEENQLEFLIKNIQQSKIDLLYPLDEDEIFFSIKYLSELSKYTSLVRLPSEESFLIAQNKWKLSDFLSSVNCNTPKGAKNNDTNELRYPILAKDVNGSFGKGILLLEDESAYTKYNLDNRNVFFEEYIEGHDLVCNVYCQDGKILSYTILEPVYFGDKGFTSKYDKHIFAPNLRVLELVTQCVQALMWNGIGSLDVRYDKINDRYLIIEMNPRYWATLISSVETGVNFPYIMLHDEVKEGENTCIEKEQVFYSLRYLIKNKYYLNNISLFNKSDLKYRLRNFKATYTSLQYLFKKRFF